jgi:hypothetical protein
MLSLCLATYVIFNGEISLLYNYTVIRYTRGRTSNIIAPIILFIAPEVGSLFIAPEVGKKGFDSARHRGQESFSL